MPEVVEEGVTGFIVDNVERAVAAVHRIADLDRGTVRTAFERRFTVERMATDYLDIYRRLAAPHPPVAHFHRSVHRAIRVPSDGDEAVPVETRFIRHKADAASMPS